MNVVLALFWVGISILVVIVVPIVIGRWVLAPINRLVRKARFRLQFQLADFFWLVVQLQIGLGVALGYVPRNETGLLTILLGYLFFATTALWIGGVIILSRAAIDRPLRRGAFIVVVLPVVLLLMIGLSIISIGASVYFYQSVMDQLYFGDRLNNGIYFSKVMLEGLAVLGVVLVSALVCWLLRRLTFWIVSEPPLLESEAETELSE